MITRFAPSPTGPLHLGHAFSALLAHDMARAENGTFLLRIEDIDQSRVRPEWEDLIYEDLAWLGVTWDGPVMRQSDRMPTYEAALTSLWRQGLLYPCTCTRRDIAEAASAPQEGAPILGPDGVVYPGTCRPGWLAPPEATPPRDVALRLDMGQAVARAFDHRVGKDGATRITGFEETGQGPNGEQGRIEIDALHMTRNVGDVVLARRDMGTSYHLSVVLDDAAQDISHVIRGADLFDATAIHATLQQLLRLPTPVYHHHRLIRDENGKRLAKRDDARAIRLYRRDGATPEDIRRLVGL